MLSPDKDESDEASQRAHHEESLKATILEKLRPRSTFVACPLVFVDDKKRQFGRFGRPVRDAPGALRLTKGSRSLQPL
ncbi:hypothetical protein V7S43_015797 [Phytophthora oleae]|uniref:Uncharacterized protein n=1 Tax=Phytophthora oleae TaxID=2107226 RepID=A0ABD3EYR5_9STRA